MPDSGDVEGSAARVCSVCGTSTMAEDPEAALAWSLAVEHGRRRSVCPTCTRTNVRSIEGKLAEEWW